MKSHITPCVGTKKTNEWRDEMISAAIKKFVNKMSKETKPLLLEYAKTADKYFWESI